MSPNETSPNGMMWNKFGDFEFNSKGGAKLNGLILQNRQNLPEIWTTVPGEPNYECSTHGKIRNIRSLHILKPKLDENGYLRVKLAGTTYRAHRLIAQSFLPNPENKTVVHHKNSVRSDPFLMNLGWVTESENMHEYYKSTGFIDDEALRAIQSISKNDPDLNSLLKQISLKYGLSLETVKKAYKWKRDYKSEEVEPGVFMRISDQVSDLESQLEKLTVENSKLQSRLEAIFKCFPNGMESLKPVSVGSQPITVSSPLPSIQPPVTQPPIKSWSRGPELKQWRLSLGHIQQTDFAPVVGVSSTTVCKWENGHHAPNFPTLEKLYSMGFPRQLPA